MTVSDRENFRKFSSPSMLIELEDFAPPEEAGAGSDEQKSRERHLGSRQMKAKARL